MNTSLIKPSWGNILIESDTCCVSAVSFEASPVAIKLQIYVCFIPRIKKTKQKLLRVSSAVNASRQQSFGAFKKHQLQLRGPGGVTSTARTKKLNPDKEAQRLLLLLQDRALLTFSSLVNQLVLS